MTTSLPRVALFLIAVASVSASCRRRYDPESSIIEPSEEVFHRSVPGLSIERTRQGGIAVRLIRAPTSFYGSSAPLYVIDDAPFQPGPGGVLTGVNPHDIESIKLLKNPADTGIYGMRGANGVIVIRTKRPGS